MINNNEMTKKLNRVIDGMVDHVREKPYYDCRTLFATSEDVVWELVYSDDCTDEMPNCIKIIKWCDGVPLTLVGFGTGYCFTDDREPIQDNLDSLKARIFNFFWDEV